MIDSKNNSSLLIDRFPDLLNEWDYEKNNEEGIDVNKITYGSKIKAWWHCNTCSGHYKMQVNSKTRGNGCPFCAGKQALSGFNDLLTLYADLIESSWDWIENDKHGIHPNELTKGSHIEAYWHCDACDGHYRMHVYRRISMNGCPYCAGRKVLAGFNDLQSKYPDLVNSEWDWSRNNQNGLKPDEITYGSHKLAAWKCSTHGHEYDMTINHRITGIGCPYCAGAKVLPGFNDLQSKYPDLIYSEWDWKHNDSMGIKHDGITAYSKIKVWWHCKTCNGHYKMIVNQKTLCNYGCPYCSGHRVLPGYNDLQTLYPNIAKEWYQPMNGDVMPVMVTKGAHIIRIPDPEVNSKRTISVKPAWKCSECGHIWRTSICDRTGADKNSCPACAKRISKQENQVADFIRNSLCTHYVNMTYTMFRSIKFKRIYEMLGIDAENVLSDTLQQHLLKELDIYIPELNFAVEYDGDYWHNDERMMERCDLTNNEAHVIKKQLCKQAGIELIFISEHDWVHDTVNVKNTMITLLNEKISYRKPLKIFNFSTNL